MAQIAHVANKELMVVCSVVRRGPIRDPLKPVDVQLALEEPKFDLLEEFR
jgi:hypothetical protein